MPTVNVTIEYNGTKTCYEYFVSDEFYIDKVLEMFGNSLSMVMFDKDIVRLLHVTYDGNARNKIATGNFHAI